MVGGRCEARRDEVQARVTSCDVWDSRCWRSCVASGCFRSTTTITVKQDGSGTIDQEIGASAGAMALLRNFASGDQADKKTSADVQLFGPEQAQAAAAAMGVRFVSGEPVKTAEVEGYRAHFAFDDVTKVKFSVNKTPPGPGAGAAEKAEDPPFAFGFAKGQRQFRADDQHSRAEAGRNGHAAEDAGQQRIAPGQRARDVDAHADASRPVRRRLARRRRENHQDERAVRRRIAGHAACSSISTR